MGVFHNFIFLLPLERHVVLFCRIVCDYNGHFCCRRRFSCWLKINRFERFPPDFKYHSWLVLLISLATINIKCCFLTYYDVGANFSAKRISMRRQHILSLLRIDPSKLFCKKNQYEAGRNHRMPDLRDPANFSAKRISMRRTVPRLISSSASEANFSAKRISMRRRYTITAGEPILCKLFCKKNQYEAGGLYRAMWGANAQTFLQKESV